MRVLRCEKSVTGRQTLVLLCMTVFFVAAGPVYGQDVGSFFISANYPLGDHQLHNNFTTHEVGTPGIGIGFILPVVTRTYGFHYKGRVAFHGVEDVVYGSDPSPDDDLYYRNLDQYVSSLNEFMIGRRFDIGETAYIHPFLGAGVLVHIIYGNHGEGLAWGSIEFDLTTQFMYRLGSFDLGLQGSFEYIPWDTYFGTANVSYVTLGAVIAK